MSHTTLMSDVDIYNIYKSNDLNKIKSLSVTIHETYVSEFLSETPLIIHCKHSDCSKESKEVIKFLVEFERINIIDKNGYTALFYTLLYGSYEIVEYLIKNGAKINNCIEFEDNKPIKVEITHIDFYNPYFFKNEYILSKLKLILDNTDDCCKDKILKMAILKQHEDIINFLVDNGVDVFTSDDVILDKRKSLLIKFKELKRLDIEKKLLNKFYCFYINVDEINIDITKLVIFFKIFNSSNEILDYFKKNKCLFILFIIDKLCEIENIEYYKNTSILIELALYVKKYADEFTVFIHAGLTELFEDFVLIDFDKINDIDDKIKKFVNMCPKKMKILK